MILVNYLKYDIMINIFTTLLMTEAVMLMILNVSEQPARRLKNLSMSVFKNYKYFTRILQNMGVNSFLLSKSTMCDGCLQINLLFCRITPLLPPPEPAVSSPVSKSWLELL